MSLICFFWFAALDPVRVSLNHLKDEFCQGTAVGAPHGGGQGQAWPVPLPQHRAESLGGTRAAPALHIWYLPGNGLRPGWDVGVHWDPARWGQAGLWHLWDRGWWPRGLTWDLKLWDGLVKGCWCPWHISELHQSKFCVENLWNLPISTVAGVCIWSIRKRWALGRVGLRRLEGQLCHLSQGDSHKDTAWEFSSPSYTKRCGL